MDRRSFFGVLIAALIVPFLPRDKFWRYHSYPVNVTIPIEIPALGHLPPYNLYLSPEALEDMRNWSLSEEDAIKYLRKTCPEMFDDSNTIL